MEPVSPMEKHAVDCSMYFFPAGGSVVSPPSGKWGRRVRDRILLCASSIPPIFQMPQMPQKLFL